MQSKKLQQELLKVPEELHELFSAVRQMNTFVCEVCKSEELNAHPELGSEWNFEWYLAMAKLARDKGWITRAPTGERDQWFFEDFEVVGPQCSGHQKGSKIAKWLGLGKK